MVGRVSKLLEEYLEHKVQRGPEKTTIQDIGGRMKSRLTESHLSPNIVEEDN
jgi:hypothetical protein